MAKGNGLVLLGVGAAFMYLMDPENGRKRRADLRNQVDATVRKVQEGKDIVVRDATNRAHGALAESRRWVEQRRARREAGLSVDAAESAAASFLSSMNGPWSPSSRAAAGALGAGMLAYGYLSGGFRGFLYSLIGGSFLARATTNREIASLLKGEALPVEKTIRIAAPVEQVFAYWRNLENFPQWMSHVREVRYIGGDRYHWSVDGPAGVPVEWDSELLNVIDNREMTWRSVDGAAVSHTGRVRFERDGDATRVHVQLRYAPIGGLIGHAIAKAFGVDPKSEMDDDLQRLKSLVETGRLPRDGAAMRALGGNGAAPSM
jgi:uncharacterized membrane protein